MDLISWFKNKDPWALFDVALDESYAKGSIYLLGDAAHASTPHLGSDAGMAFRGRVYLEESVRSFQAGGPACSNHKAVDAVRLPRTLKLVLESRQAGLANKLKEGLTDDFARQGEDVDQR